LLPVAALLLALAAPPAGAPTEISEARLSVDTRGPLGVAELRLELSRTPDALELGAVEHGSRRLRALEVSLGGRPLLVEVRSAPAPARRWRATGALEGTTLVLRYEVEGAVESRGDAESLLIPLVLPQLPGAAPRSELFRAELPLPPGHTAWDSFPSVPVDQARPGRGALQLPVIPGLVRLDSGPGAVPLLSPGRIADGLTLAVLAVLLAIGARALRRVPMGRDA
jgi:hypothetical protein